MQHANKASSIIILVFFFYEYTIVIRFSRRKRKTSIYEHRIQKLIYSHLIIKSNFYVFTFHESLLLVYFV
jgi:hypothetical protein